VKRILRFVVFLGGGAASYAFAQVTAFSPTHHAQSISLQGVALKPAAGVQALRFLFRDLHSAEYLQRSSYDSH
jgi:hypothetical protein